MYDPEHGGGRRRRNKRHPERKRFTDDDDKLTYNNKDLNKCFELSDDEEERIRNPFTIAQLEAQKDCTGSTEDFYPENIVEDDEEDDEIIVPHNLYYSVDGEAHQLPYHESAHCDYGLQNAITGETLNQLI